MRPAEDRFNASARSVLSQEKPPSLSGALPTKLAAGGRFAGRSYRLEDLTLQIRQHFPDLDPELQKRIRSHFEVDDSNRRDIKAGLKLAL